MKDEPGSEEAPRNFGGDLTTALDLVRPACCPEYPLCDCWCSWNTCMFSYDDETIESMDVDAKKL